MACGPKQLSALKSTKEPNAGGQRPAGVRPPSTLSALVTMSLLPTSPLPTTVLQPVQTVTHSVSSECFYLAQCRGEYVRSGGHALEPRPPLLSRTPEIHLKKALQSKGGMPKDTAGKQGVECAGARCSSERQQARPRSEPRPPRPCGDPPSH